MSLKKQPEQFNPNSGTNNDTTNTIQEDEGIQENSSKKQPEQCDANSDPKIENNINNYSTMNVNQADVLYQTCPGSINQTIYVKTVNQNQSPTSTWITTCSSMILLISILISIIIIIIILISIYFSKSENQLQNNKPPIHNFSVNNITPLAQVENLSFPLDKETLNRIKQWAFEATKKATEDSPQKYYQLGYMSYKGIGTEKNLETATEYLEKAKENPEAKILLAKIYEKEEKAKKLYKEALDEFQNLAIQDNIEAKIYLWYMYKNGLGGKKELDKAKKWYLEIVQEFEKIYKEDSENTKKNLDIYYKNRNEDNNKSSDYLTTQKIRYRHLNLDQEELEELKKIEFYVVQKNAIEDNTKAKYDLYYMYKMGIGIGIGIKQKDEKPKEWLEKAKNNPQAGESSLYLYRLEPDFTNNNVDNYLQCFAKIEDIETLIYLYAKNINNIKERDQYTKMIKGQFIKDAKEYYQYSKNKLNQQEKDKIQNIEEDTIDNFYVFLINLWKIYALGSEEDEEQAKYWYNRVINCLYEHVKSEDKFSEKALFYLGKIFNIKINIKIKIESDDTRKKELQKTIDEYKRSANKENAIVQYYYQVIDHLFRDEKSKSKDDAKKHVNEIITSLKKKDNGISQYNLGLLYYNLIEQELKKAFNDLKKTFLDNQRDEGNFKKIYYDESEDALENVCKWIKENDENKEKKKIYIEIPLNYIKLSYTEIVEDTIKHVLKLFQESANNGNTDAELQFKLGELFLYYKVHKDIKEAYESFKKSTYDKVELNTKRKEDLNNAFNWFELSAEKNADAQYMLGMHYYRREDSKNALYWFELSANNGNADAQYMLGMHYYRREDSKNALYWLKKSAYQGNARAQFKILTNKNQDKN